MKILNLIIFFILIVALPSVSAQVNLFQPAGANTLSVLPITSVGNSIYYMSAINDTASNGKRYRTHAINRVQLATGALQQSFKLPADTSYFNWQGQQNAGSYCYNKFDSRFYFFYVLDRDSGSNISSTAQRYPATVYMTVLDTNLNTIVQQQPILHYSNVQSRYALGGVDFVFPVSDTQMVFSYYVRDTFISNELVTAAIKFGIVNKNGVIRSNGFLGYEPLGTTAFFPAHTVNDRIYKLNDGSYLAMAIFSDSIGLNSTTLILDSNFQLISAFISELDYQGVPIPGKNYVNTGLDNTIFIHLPTGSLIKSAIGQYLATGETRARNMMAISKSSIVPPLSATQVYFTPPYDTADYIHTSYHSFPHTVWNPHDNRIYNFNNSNSYVQPPCLGNTENVAQLVCLDTLLNERYIKYIKAQPGRCITTYSVTAPHNKPGIIISGIDNSLNFSTPPRFFIYYIDSATRLGIDKSASIIVADRFTVSPNPANDFVTIDNALPQAYTLAVYDMLGRMVHTAAHQSQRNQVNTSTWPAGNYIFRLTAKDGTVVNQKILKQ